MRKRLHVVTHVHTYSHAYLHDVSHTVTFGGIQRTELDQLDEKILTLLQADPRMDLVKMGSKTKIAATTVAYRIKRLKKDGVLLGCMPRLDLNRIGYTLYRIELLLKDPAQKNAVVSYLELHKNVLRVYELIGDVDLAFEAHFTGILAVDAFLLELKKAIKNVRNFEVRAIIRG